VHETNPCTSQKIKGKRVKYWWEKVGTGKYRWKKKKVKGKSSKKIETFRVKGKNLGFAKK
jgi:hypothetical protein